MAVHRLAVLAAGVLLLGSTRLANAAAVPKSYIYHRADDILTEYDYVIVGGGTAGLTVADRLTENPGTTVLVIELGTIRNESFVSTIAYGYQALFDPSLFYQFTSVPQVGLNNRTGDVWGGVMLGGSSGVNALQVQRGQREDYDRWGSYFGTRAKWSWNDLLPYFKKAWNFHAPPADTVQQFDIKYDTSYWGTSSNIHASWPTENYPSLKPEMDAFKDIPGVQFPADSGAGRAGAFWYPASVDPSIVQRSFSRTGHWDGIEALRPNYHTLTSHRVLKVSFQGDTATGVVFTTASATNTSNSLTVKAKKEVIVSAGGIHSPQILQASGIGPKPLLDSAGIPVVVDLPGVGANLQDHPYSIGGARFNYTNWPFFPGVDDLLVNATLLAEATAQFAANRTGLLTIASGNAAGFLPMTVVAPSAVAGIALRLATQDHAAYLPTGTHKTVVAGYRRQMITLAATMLSGNSAWYNLFLRGGQQEGSPILLHPLSRGTVTIDPADPFFAQPRVDYRALSNPADLEVLVEFVRFTRRYFLETRLAAYGPVEIAPGANLTTSAQIGAALRDTLIPTSFHAVGTSAMMPRKLGGVVDQKLRVYGVKRLSVVDASVMPDLPGAYTQQTTYAIAEKAADMIKARA